MENNVINISGTQHQRTKSDVFAEISRELLCLYNKKNADYGDSFGQSFDEFGIESAVIRLGDKYRRIKSLALNKEQRVKDESIEDTLKDMANYAIMTLIELRKTK